MVDAAELVTVRLTKAQALAAGAVLRGYVAHQRERMGEQAETNLNYRNVQGALAAFERAAGPSPDEAHRQRPETGS